MFNLLEGIISMVIVHSYAKLPDGNGISKRQIPNAVTIMSVI